MKTIYYPGWGVVWKIYSRENLKKSIWLHPKFFAKRLFLKKVADAFTRVYESYMAGIIRRLAVSMPPRAGKSYISSLFIAWMLGHFPEESVMRNCCSDTLYNKLSYDTRDIVRSSRFKEVFPDVKLVVINRTCMAGAWKLPGR